MKILDIRNKYIYFVYNARKESGFVFVGPKWACMVVAGWLGVPYDVGTYNMMKGK